MKPLGAQSIQPIVASGPDSDGLFPRARRARQEMPLWQAEFGAVDNRRRSKVEGGRGHLRSEAGSDWERNGPN
jgi:hypothetical protein